MLTIRLDGQLEQRLKEAAATAGTEPQAVAEHLLDQSLPKPNAASLALLADWERQNATTDPGELDRRREETEILMTGLAKSRVETEGPVSRRLWP
jgi:hypothetical protein